MKTLKFAQVWILILLVSCASAQPTNSPQASNEPVEVDPLLEATEILGKGDVFEVNVYDEPELTGKFRVSGDGSITMALAGRLNVEGLTLAQTEDLIKQRLSQFVKEPHVSVFVEQFNSRKLHIFGRVKNPGTLKYEEGMNLIEVITRAGGLHELANGDKTSITRVIDGQKIKSTVSIKEIQQGDQPNVAVFPGDIIFVPESVF